MKEIFKFLKKLVLDEPPSVFTTEQRSDIYWEARRIYKENPNVEMGMCSAILQAVSFLYPHKIKETDLDFQLDFPELYMVKPFWSASYTYWWPVRDREIRLQKFKIIIDAVYDKRQKELKKLKKKGITDVSNN